MLIFFLVALTASVAGAICGIGGGVIIKPVLDLLHLETVTAISFLSGCTVLSMSCYSVGKSLLAKEHSVSLNVGTPLALGAAAGQDLAAVGGGHALAEAVDLLAVELLGLIGTNHAGTPPVQFHAPP